MIDQGKGDDSGMAKIGKWEVVRKGKNQIHWHNTKSKMNLIVNKERDGSYSGIAVRNDSAFRHRSKSKQSMVDWAIRYMKLNLNG